MKTTKLFKTILSLLMVLALLAACTPAAEENNNPGDNNAAQYEGLEKEEYLQKLYENDLGAAVDSLGEVYGAILGGMSEGTTTTPTAAGAKLNITLTLSDEVMDSVEQGIFGGEAPVSMDFLKEINLDMDIGMKDQMQAMQLALGLKGQQIITANLLMNMADSVMHIALPELNDQWLKIEAGETVPNVITGGMSSTAMMAELADALPDAETLTKVLDRYLALVLPELKNVEQTATKLELYGLEQECTALTLKIYEADALAIAKAVLTAAKDDADLKKIIEDVAKAVEDMAGQDIGADGAYTDFQEAITDMLADLNEVTETDTENPITLVTYVDKNHNIIGMKLSMSAQDSNRGMAYYYTITEGDQFAVEFAIPSDVDDTDDFKLSGNGTKKDGKTNGTYTVAFEGEDCVTIKVEDLTDEAGTITLTPDKKLLSKLGIPTLEGNPALQIKLGGDTVELNLVDGSKVMIGIKMKATESDGPSLNVPSDAVDITDSSALEKWTEKLVMDKVMENLEKAGAADFIELLFQAQQAPAQPMPEYSVAG